MGGIRLRRFRLLRRVFQYRSMRPDLEAEIDAEIEDHLRRTRDALVREGVSPDRARREADLRFGDRDRHRARIVRFNRRRGRRERMTALFDAVVESIRGALRGMRANPAVTVTIVVTVALGIGANATMFGIVDRLLLRPPDHILEPQRVVRIYVDRAFRDSRTTSATVAYPDFVDWTAADSFTAVAAVSNTWGTGNTTVGRGADARKIMSQKATPSFFRLLGVRPLHGRFLTEDDDVAGSARFVVLGHDFWRSSYGADPGAVGRTILLDGVPHEIVGVAPLGFTGVELERIDAWLPLRSGTGWMDPEHWEESRGMYWLRAIGRLAPGVDPAAAAAEATALHRAGRSADERYDSEAVVRLGSIIAARGINPSSESTVARWLAAVSAIVLLIACANVANILLARGARRSRDLGVRMALGVSRRRLFGHLMVESLVLSLVGGAAALLIAGMGARVVRALLLPTVHWIASPVSLRVLGFTFAAAMSTGLLAGLAPAVAATRQDAVALLGGASTGGFGAGRSRLRTSMLVLQTTLSVVLLVGAGLFVRSLAAVRSVDLGFDPDGLLVAIPEVDDDRLEEARRGEFFEQAARRLRGLGGVTAVTTSVSIPFYSSFSEALTVPEVPEPPSFPTGGPYILGVDHEFFGTMGIAILRGRGFTAEDATRDAGVVILGQTMADAYWPDGDGLGKCVKLGGDEAPCSTVVGVAEDTARSSLRQQKEALYYAPFRQQGWTPEALFVRIHPDVSEDLTAAVRREITSTDDAVRYADVQPLRALIDPQARSWWLGASMFSVFGGLALVIAAVGLYGVMSFNVAQRRHEIGVRSALGAEPGRLVRLVVGQSVLVVAGSLGAGTGLAMLAGRWVEPLLYEVRALDPTVLVAVVGLLLAVTVVASAVPARRAVRVDPVEALRVD